MIKKLVGSLKRERNTFMLYAHLSGNVKKLSEVPDEVFSGGMLGDGVAIVPDSGILYSPCAGVVEHIFDTQHAINIISDFGGEILLHIGIDTVKLRGKGFEVKVKEGERVNKGDILCTFDIDVIKGAGLSTITPMVICNSSEYGSIEVISASSVKVGTAVLKVMR